MAKQNVAEQETLGEAMNKTELFFERNGRTMSYVFLGLLVLAALVFGYRSLILQPRATKAAEMIAEAQNRFEGENPDFETALLGETKYQSGTCICRQAHPCSAILVSLDVLQYRLFSISSSVLLSWCPPKHQPSPKMSLQNSE